MKIFGISAKLLSASMLAAAMADIGLAAEAENQDLTILRLKKIIAEQSMAALLEYEKVREYERIRSNYERLLRDIFELEKKEKARDGKQ
jgi:hypothetical protein